MDYNELLKRIEKLETDIKNLGNNSTFPYNVEQALRTRLRDLTPDLPDGFENAPLNAITAPSGGATVDSQARTAINDIITRLEDLGLVDSN